MFIKRLSVKNFKNFRELEIDFTQLRGCYEVSGPVGSGKTSIPEAILFGLYGTVKNINIGELLTFNEKQGVVRVDLETQSRNITIIRTFCIRGQVDLQVFINGSELFNANKRFLQLDLEQYFDSSKSLIQMLCIISFSNFKSITSLNPTETKKFTEDLFDLSYITELLENLKTKQQETKLAYNELKIQKQTLQQSVDNITKSGEAVLADNSISSINESQLQALEVLQKEYTEKLKQLQQQVKECNTKILEKERALAGTNKLLTLNTKNLELLKTTHHCPICKQNVDMSVIAHLENEILKTETIKQSYSSELELLNKTKNTIVTNFNEIKTQNEHTKQEILELKHKRDLATRLQNLKQNLDTEQVNNLNIEIDKIKVRQLELTQTETKLNELEKLLVSIYNSRIDAYTAVINKSIIQVALYMNFEFIPQFDQYFKCTISMQNQEIVPISTLSTGQKKIVDMIAILGIILAFFGNKLSNIIFFDELFSNLDEDHRTRAIAAIRKIFEGHNQTVLISSHQPICENQLDGKIVLDSNSNLQIL